MSANFLSNSVNSFPNLPGVSPNIKLLLHDSYRSLSCNGMITSQSHILYMLMLHKHSCKHKCTVTYGRGRQRTNTRSTKSNTVRKGRITEMRYSVINCLPIHYNYRKLIDFSRFKFRSHTLTHYYKVPSDHSSFTMKAINLTLIKTSTVVLVNLTIYQNNDSTLLPSEGNRSWCLK